MRNILWLLPLLLVAACADEPTPEEKAAADERAIALVDKGNATPPPMEPVSPEPILYPDMEEHDLHGSACSYAAGTSIAALVIARQQDAFMKIEGEMVRFAADSGSESLPLGTRARYVGPGHELRLAVAGGGTQTASERIDSEGTITLLDPQRRVVYEGAGHVQCGG